MEEIENILFNSSGSLMFCSVMLSKISIWSNFPLQFWLACLEKIKNRPLSLYAYIPFTYKILGIDLIASFWNLNDLQFDTIEYMKDSLRDDHRLLYLSEIDLGVLKQFDSDIFLDLIKIKERLVKDGARSVDKIFIGIGHSPIEVSRDDFFVQCYKENYSASES